MNKKSLIKELKKLWGENYLITMELANENVDRYPLETIEKSNKLIWEFLKEKRK